MLVSEKLWKTFEIEGEFFFVNNEKQAQKSLLKPMFICCQFLHIGVVSVAFGPSWSFWSKPTPEGASIPDLSKLSRYKFHYDDMKPRFADKLKICCKDTDSLLYRVETKNLYSEMATFKPLLDLSDYPQEHFLHEKTKKKIPLMMTDEWQGKVMCEVVCLQSKVYSFQFWRRCQTEWKKSTEKCQKNPKIP